MYNFITLLHYIIFQFQLSQVLAGDEVGGLKKLVYDHTLIIALQMI